MYANAANYANLYIKQLLLKGAVLLGVFVIEPLFCYSAVFLAKEANDLRVNKPLCLSESFYLCSGDYD